MKVIFVCTGNTCRSPMAEAYLRSKLIPGLTAESRGFCADGLPAAENAVTVMAEAGIDLSEHRSRQFSGADLSADRIVCLSPAHRISLLAVGASESQLLLLGDGIPDPYGGDVDVYRRCRNAIFAAIDVLVNGGFFTPFRIVPIAQKHIAAVAKLERVCFAEPWSAEAILDSYAAGTKFFVAVDNERVLGYVGISVVLDEGYFTNIAVFESCRQMGVGSLLIDRVFQLARERALRFVSLEVRRSNEAAIRLYTKFGFRQEGERRGYYRNPSEDAVIMTRRFTEADENTQH